LLKIGLHRLRVDDVARVYALLHRSQLARGLLEYVIAGKVNVWSYTWLICLGSSLGLIYLCDLAVGPDDYILVVTWAKRYYFSCASSR
jgi:hypothetical protein